MIVISKGCRKQRRWYLLGRSGWIHLVYLLQGDVLNYKCWVSEQDVNLMGNYEIKLIENDNVIRIRGNADYRITRPVDVEAIE